MKFTCPLGSGEAFVFGAGTNCAWYEHAPLPRATQQRRHSFGSDLHCVAYWFLPQPPGQARGLGGGRSALEGATPSARSRSCSSIAALWIWTRVVRRSFLAAPCPDWPGRVSNLEGGLFGAALTGSTPLASPGGEPPATATPPGCGCTQQSIH